MNPAPSQEAPVVQFVWEFVAREDKLKEFERYYSSEGLWAALFRKHPGYCGTILLRDAENPRRFLTVDRWDSFAAHVAMRAQFSAEYEALDRACESFTESERRIGVFEDEYDENG
jgi:heme-degrading monooxygenase HmoA